MSYKIEVTDNSQLVTKKLKAAAIKGLTECGMTAEGYAKKLCPVDTGNLRNSITYTVRDGEYATYIGTNVEYANYVENGTSKMAAQPYLKPAVTDHSDTYKRLIRVELENA